MPKTHCAAGFLLHHRELGTIAHFVCFILYSHSLPFPWFRKPRHMDSMHTHRLEAFIMVDSFILYACIPRARQLSAVVAVGLMNPCRFNNWFSQHRCCNSKGNFGFLYLRTIFPITIIWVVVLECRCALTWSILSASLHDADAFLLFAIAGLFGFNYLIWSMYYGMYRARPCVGSLIGILSTFLRLGWITLC